MYYVYRHIRNDKNEVFYIGIGTKPNAKNLRKLGNTHRGIYYRAFHKNKSRNAYWKNITNITTYNVEIVFESNNVEEVKAKEIELIALYKDTLCNLTIGGDGIESYKHTEEAKQRIRISLLGRRRPENVKEKINKAKLKPVRMYNGTLSLIFNSRKEAALYLGNEDYQYNIGRAIRTGIKAYGYNFESADSKDKEP